MRKTPSAELRELVDRLLFEGGLGRVETSRLEEVLKDPKALRYYTETMAQESMMAEALEGVGEEAPAGSRRRLPAAAVLAAAVCAVFFALGFFTGKGSGPRQRQEAEKRSGVRVTGLVGVEWEEGGAPSLAAGGVSAERVAFRTGLVELTYANGVRVTMEGPADFSVKGGVAGTLRQGKLVAYVPPGAEGFTVDYSGGKVVDLGTEFAMEVSGEQAEVGVFDGEVSLRLPGDEPRSLFQNQAVIHTEEGPERLRAVPLDREKFVRRLPARDFRWEVASQGLKTEVFDVTHLIWKPSDYRAIFKWMRGRDAVVIRGVELRRDNVPVSADFHEGVTGKLALVKDNVFSLDVRPGDFTRGRWTLHATMETFARGTDSSKPGSGGGSLGLLQFEEGLVSTATKEDFVGRWSYYYLGRHYVREFRPDGYMDLYKDGSRLPRGVPSPAWEVVDGVLKVEIPGTDGVFEHHVLRDRDTLIFVSNPYGNAERMKDEE